MSPIGWYENKLGTNLNNDIHSTVTQKGKGLITTTGLKIIFNRIRSNLDKNNIANPNQSAYKPRQKQPC